jgi:glucan biosynthesis protein
VLDRYKLNKVAVLNGYVRTELSLLVHVYATNFYVGSPTETEDSEKPVWHYIDKLPTEEMHSGDGEWMTRVLKGEKLRVNMFSSCLGSTPHAIDFRPFTH